MLPPPSNVALGLLVVDIRGDGFKLISDGSQGGLASFVLLAGQLVVARIGGAEVEPPHAGFQEEVRLLLRQHPGVERGLDLFGVDVPNPLKEMPGRLGQLSPEANAAWADIEEAECARRIAASPEP